MKNFNSIREKEFKNMYEKCVNFIGAYNYKKLLENYDSNDKDVPHSFRLRLEHCTIY